MGKPKIDPGSAEYFRAALEKIHEARGRYSRDRLEHCSNVVEEMRRIAQQTLDHEWDPSED